MKLPDFLEFDAFNAMRASVGTDQLGNFEFFDPNTQLTGDERSELVRLGMIVKPRHVRLFSDHTLGYKNSRIAIAGQELAHLTVCSDLSEATEYRILAPGKILDDYKPCRQCLHELRYQGFDAMRERKKAHSEHVYATFSYQQYFRLKPDYPVDCVALTIRTLNRN